MTKLAFSKENVEIFSQSIDVDRMSVYLRYAFGVPLSRTCPKTRLLEHLANPALPADYGFTTQALHHLANVHTSLASYQPALKALNVGRRKREIEQKPEFHETRLRNVLCVAMIAERVKKSLKYCLVAICTERTNKLMPNEKSTSTDNGIARLFNRAKKSQQAASVVFSKVDCYLDRLEAQKQIERRTAAVDLIVENQLKQAMAIEEAPKQVRRVRSDKGKKRGPKRAKVGLEQD